MIIGIDASRANREHKTGTEWYSYYLIRCLAQIDKKNTYILYSDKPLSGGLIDLKSGGCNDNNPKIFDPKYDRKGYQILDSPYNNFMGKILSWPYKYFWTQGRLSLEMLLNKVDVLFVPAHTLPLIHPQHSVVTIHDIGFERESRLYGHEIILQNMKRTHILLDFLVRIFTAGKYGANTFDYLRWSSEFAVKKADKIITVSQHTKKDIEIFYKADSSKIKVIYNGYNNKLYKKITDINAVDNVLEKYGLSKPYIFYVGRIEKKKNIYALIEAFYNLKMSHPELKHKLVLAGDASYGYDETQYLIKEFGIEEDVILPGWVSEVDMPYLFNGADLFVYPSIYEGFGIPLLQAMACEIPIAASYVTSIPEIAGGAASFFDPYSIKSMTDAIYNALSDHDLRTRLILNGSKIVSNFNWEKCTEETWKVVTYQE